jgi:hypothetical protein
MLLVSVGNIFIIHCTVQTASIQIQPATSLHILIFHSFSFTYGFECCYNTPCTYLKF